MATDRAGFLFRMMNERLVRRWSQVSGKADQLSLRMLRRQADLARKLRGPLNELIHHADYRLALPHIGSSGIAKAHGTDWAWRPEVWRGALPEPGIASVANQSKLGEEVTIFHDCKVSEITLRQLRNTSASDLAPFGLRLDVFRFDGSFLSVVIDLPDAGLRGLTRQHLIRVETLVETERPLEIFARLNVKHGPNTEQIVRELPLHEHDIVVEFDLAYSKINEKRIEKAWIDLIFEGPEMNQVVLRDLTLSRRLRAEL